jgi:hypothetical protein
MIKGKRCKRKIKRKTEKFSQRSDTRLDLDCLFPGNGARKKGLLTVDYRIKGPFFPQVVNPRYRIRGTMCNARIQSSKARKAIL